MRKVTIAGLIALLFTAGCGDLGSSAPEGQRLPLKKIVDDRGSSSMVCDRFGRLFVADALNGTISCVHENGVRVVMAEGLGDIGGLVLDGMNNVFVCSRTKGEVYRIKSDGTVTVAARGLDRPYELAVDRDGNVFAATAGDGGIWRIPRASLDIR